MIEDIGEQWVKYITRPIAGAGGLLAAVHRRRLVAPLLPFAVAFIVLLAWWSIIEVSNDRVWQPDVTMLSSAEIEGDVITLYNVRSFTYRTLIPDLGSIGERSGHNEDPWGRRQC